MKLMNISNEDEMILEFLKGEINSKRFNKVLLNLLSEMNINKKVILKGNLNNCDENKTRLKIMYNYRGYPDKDLFNNFPNIICWNFVKFQQEDINKLYYINYDYWNELSNYSSLPTKAAENIKQGKEIYQISNESYIDGIKYLDNNNFSPIIRKKD